MGWILIDCVGEITYEEEHPAIEIGSEAHLRHELQRLRNRTPSIVNLCSPVGEMLMIAIGGAFAGLRWMREPTVDYFRVSVNSCPLTDKGVEFRDHGTETAFRPQYLFPPEEVIEEVVHFFNNQKFSDRMKWNALGRKDQRAT